MVVAALVAGLILGAMFAVLPVQNPRLLVAFALTLLLLGFLEIRALGWLVGASFLIPTYIGLAFRLRTIWPAYLAARDVGASVPGRVTLSATAVHLSGVASWPRGLAVELRWQDCALLLVPSYQTMSRRPVERYDAAEIASIHLDSARVSDSVPTSELQIRVQRGGLEGALILSLPGDHNHGNQIRAELVARIEAERRANRDTPIGEAVPRRRLGGP